MAVRIRLKRMGKIHAPFYRVVVVDSRKKRDGRVIEEIGIYDPKPNPSIIRIDSERAQYWMGVGAQPSDPVRRLLTLTGDIARFHGKEDAVSRVIVADVDREAQVQAAVQTVADEAEKKKAAAAEEKAKQEAAAAAEAAEAESTEEAPVEAPTEEASADEAKSEEKAEEAAEE